MKLIKAPQLRHVLEVSGVPSEGGKPAVVTIIKSLCWVGNPLSMEAPKACREEA